MLAAIPLAFINANISKIDKNTTLIFIKNLGLTENDQKLEKDVQGAFNFLFTQDALMAIQQLTRKK